MAPIVNKVKRRFDIVMNCRFRVLDKEVILVSDSTTSTDFGVVDVQNLLDKVGWPSLLAMGDHQKEGPRTTRSFLVLS